MIIRPLYGKSTSRDLGEDIFFARGGTRMIIRFRLPLTLLAALFFWIPVIAGQADPEGVYQFIEDQPSHYTAAEGSEILLSIAPGGMMTVTASKPGEVMTGAGSYRLQGDRISIDFPELGKSVKAGRWKLEEDILTLPLQFIGDGPGTSRWRRIRTGDGPIKVFFETLNREYEAGTKAGQAVQRAAEEAKRASILGASEKALRISGIHPWVDGRGCTLEFEDGHEEEVLAATGSVEAPAAQKQVIGPLARDPRTHIPAQPHTSPDDPKNKTAVLFAPFDTTPFYVMDWGLAGASVPTSVFRVASHASLGENLDFIKNKLLSRNYEVVTLKNDEATPLALHDAILSHAPAPGVIYMSTHGAAHVNGRTVYLCTGVNLGFGHQENDIHKPNERLRDIIRRTCPAGYSWTELEPRLSVEAKPVVALWMQKDRNLPVAYLSITSSFFERIRREGADFSSSFIYANACHSAHNNSLAESSGARMVLGNRIESNFRAAAVQARWIFTRLAKRTFSLREVLGLMSHVVKTLVEIFPEDGWLARVRREDDANLRLFGADGKEAAIPEFGVLYLCWMARWSVKDTEAGAEALDKTYVEYWSKKSFSRLKSPFANAGVRGSHVPTEEEVTEARHLVSGVPALPCGRFTLNDKDPGKDTSRK